MPESNVNLEKSKLCRIIEENLPGASVVGGPRKFFREELGMEYINQVFALKESSWQKLTLEEDVESVKVAISARYTTYVTWRLTKVIMLFPQQLQLSST